MDKTLISFKLAGKVLFSVFVFLVTLMLLISIFDTDKTVSEKENRSLEPMPKFSISALFSGELIKSFETHYSDTFPFRNFFLDVNSKIQGLTSQFTAGEDDIVIIDSTKTEDDFAGESLDEAQE